MAETETAGRARRRLLTLAGWLVVGLVLLVWIYLDYRVSVDSPLPIRQPVSLTIKKGQGIGAVTQDLRQRGIVAEPVWIRLLARVQGVSQQLKYGEYELSPGLTQRGLLDMIVSGRTRHLPVTIIEGWTFRQMRALLAQHPGLRQETADKTPEEIMTLVGMPGRPPEGQFFPDTYFTSRTTSDLDILRQAHRKMQSLLAAEWAARAPNLPLASPEDALTLASIVEKETGRDEERPAIAGVFVRRLQQGMRLQTDPTVIYGMGDLFKGNLRKDDLRRDTPYNTYTRAGLPPTPIALPGRRALHAALHPAEGTALYFVGKGDGSHVFSTTLDEHERAVDHYQRHR